MLRESRLQKVNRRFSLEVFGSIYKKGLTYTPLPPLQNRIFTHP